MASTSSTSASSAADPAEKAASAGSARPPGHRIGVCSWSLAPADPQQLIAGVQRLNLDAVQLALSPMVNVPDTWREVITLLRDAGIDILSGMMQMRGEDYSSLQSIAQTGGVRPDAHWEDNMAHARAVGEIAARHHIGLVTFHAGFIPHDSSDHGRGRMLDRLRAIADYFSSIGVALALETGQETADTLLDALEALERPNVGVNFDPANMILYGMGGEGGPVEALRMLQSHVRQVHVKDAIPAKQSGTWGTETPVGDGDVDWPQFFAVAREIQPPVNFIIERESGTPGRQRENDIASAADLIRRHLNID